MRCLLIEDELPAQRILQRYLALVPGLELVGTYASALEAAEALQSPAVDVLFLDIHLPLLSGLDFVRTLVQPPRIVITTAYPDYAVEGFELDVVDYLVKPFSFDRFLRAVNKVRGTLPAPPTPPAGANPQVVFVNSDKALHKIDLAEVLYVESVKDYVRIVTGKQKIMLLDSLKNWELRLPAPPFLRIHKTFIVNLQKIEKVYGNTVVLPTAELPIGRTYKEDFLRRLQEVGLPQ